MLALVALATGCGRGARRRLEDRPDSLQSRRLAPCPQTVGALPLVFR